ncbi:uncharacterized protein STEHIDRAFT_54879 [Stereum hirsutum FP-91666 SS1]|uniref:uncharacterized protein n=1 Tax=Stereum hirsutum (strain FP-91666) TaxID=721885 RepID=UPI000440DB11|nr:uncharacterized protein STEHIDRAFT_54879 [Stereum hirsutum FP-91666 SS1]EIM87944.1 hypothetical protein STEHIDRAFT_54879 [Stereum hirsutum FP-91666 SS1]
MLGTLVVALSIALVSYGQSSTDDEPIPGDYSGALRPQIHYSPPVGFMNDPNGMFLDADGTYHLYYQYNPTEIVAGNQHWGHATSQDLYHWTNQKIAIAPSGAEGEGIFSGSAVIDVNNTSGFFPNQTDGVVAIYTLNTNTAQTQDIAYSVDGGYTFTKYENNPVIDVNSTQFRDPKVLWYSAEDGTGWWSMVVAHAQDFVLTFYTSPNLREWTFASNFSHVGLLGLQWECPNLVTMPVEGTDETMYLLFLSINPGAPLGGSISQYYPGYFNGTHFTPVDGVTRLSDFAKDNYAGQFFYGIPEDQPAVSIAWASNWQYTEAVPTGAEGWRSSMSLPRLNTLKNVTRVGWDLVSKPYDLSPLFDGEPLAQNENLGNGQVVVDYSNVTSGAVYFQANLTGIPTDGSSTGTLNFTFYSSVSGENITGGFFLDGDTPFWIDRGSIRGFDNFWFTDKFLTNNLLLGGTGNWSLEAVVDRTLLEVFLADGERSGTVSFFPEERLDGLVVGTNGLNEGIEVSLVVRGLESAWADEEVGGGNGTVLGNVTTSA